jgi:hypothetical protein
MLTVGRNKMFSKLVCCAPIVSALIVILGGCMRVS